MKSLILKAGQLMLMICCSLLVELTFDGNRFTKESALVAISVAVIVFTVINMIKLAQPEKKLE
jgi:hypothetical protein